MYGESEFDIFKAKKRFPDPGKTCVLKRKLVKMQLFASIETFPESGKHFFALQMSNSDSPHVFTLEGSFPKTNFFTCVVDRSIFFCGKIDLFCSSFTFL